MHKNPVRNRPKNVLLTGHSSLGMIEHANHRVAWADVWLEYKGGVYRDKAKRNSRKDRTVYLGPCLIDGGDIDNSIEFTERLISEVREELRTGVGNKYDFLKGTVVYEKPFGCDSHEKMLLEFTEEEACYRRIKAHLYEAGNAFYIEENAKHTPGIPQIYTRDPLVRKTAEAAIRFYLAERKGLRNLRLVWERPEVTVYAVGH